MLLWLFEQLAGYHSSFAGGSLFNIAFFAQCFNRTDHWSSARSCDDSQVASTQMVKP